MLTSLTQKTNFQPLMNMKAYRLILLLIATLVLQSCYTLIYPPATYPQTMTTVVTEPAMASTIGVSAAYGYDPYWEPALPFTSYHRGYGASYYSPYNYYDYHHPRYAPVYVVSETTRPRSGRDFDRDQEQGGSRDRNRNNSASGSSSGDRGTTVGIGSSSASSAAPIKTPIISPPVIQQPIKTRTPRGIAVDPPRVTPIIRPPVSEKPIKSRSQKTVVAPPSRPNPIKQAVVSTPKPVKENKEADSKSPPSSKKKRNRTRK